MERESWTSGEIPGVILHKEMTARTPKECMQVLSVRGGRLRSRMFDTFSIKDVGRNKKKVKLRSPRNA